MGMEDWDNHDTSTSEPDPTDPLDSELSAEDQGTQGPREYATLNRIEKTERYRLALGYCLLYGGRAQDAAELLRTLSGYDVNAEQVNSRVRYKHSSASEYATSLVGPGVKMDMTQRNTVRPLVVRYLSQHHPSPLWRYEPRGAAIAYYTLSSQPKPSVRVFSDVMASFYNNKNASQAIGGVLRRARKQVGNEDALLRELNLRAGTRRLNALRDLAGSLLRECTQARDKKLHHRAGWQQIPEIRQLVANLLEQNVSGAQLRAAVHAANKDVEMKESSAYRLIYRYQEQPALILERLRKGFETETTPEGDEDFLEQENPALASAIRAFSSADYWKRNPRSALIVARSLGLGADMVSLLHILKSNYPTHNIPNEILVSAFATPDGRADAMNALDRNAGWLSVSEADRAFIEERAREYVGAAQMETHEHLPSRPSFTAESVIVLGNRRTPLNNAHLELLRIMREETFELKRGDDARQVERALRYVTEAIEKGTIEVRENVSVTVDPTGRTFLKDPSHEQGGEMIPTLSINIELRMVTDERAIERRWAFAQRLVRILSAENPAQLSEDDRKCYGAFMRCHARRIIVYVPDRFRVNKSQFSEARFPVCSFLRKP